MPGAPVWFGRESSTSRTSRFSQNHDRSGLLRIWEYSGVSKSELAETMLPCRERGDVGVRTTVASSHQAGKPLVSVVGARRLPRSNIMQNIYAATPKGLIYQVNPASPNGASQSHANSSADHLVA